jgi:hypothetical protein
MSLFVVHAYSVYASSCTCMHVFEICLSLFVVALFGTYLALNLVDLT